MGWKSTRESYGGAAIALHWLAVVLVVAAYCTMEFKSAFPKGSPGREVLALWHYALGLAVFALVWVRLLVRAFGAEPAIQPTLPRWQAMLATITHWALYALMALLPLLGWLTVSAKGVDVSILGLHLPMLVPKNPDLAKVFKTLHEGGASVGYFLVGLHAAAALYHHYVRRDNTLRLMLPRRR